MLQQTQLDASVGDCSHVWFSDRTVRGKAANCHAAQLLLLFFTLTALNLIPAHLSLSCLFFHILGTEKVPVHREIPAGKRGTIGEKTGYQHGIDL